ncbi:Chromosome-anchoring protein RacA [Bacillus sp. THAF10]|uniref:MerR family transcriptional regulator n=1 Tax=Bacillus sp. THAF10 TaxID=2587848 RepID=UPI0012686582|nr:MerR family transcriptional regulator [Bacillus sp. THAF10]QFT88126.1 Chromosome-anchoring protein RacA [Bacillus sp. THAF10]
MLLKTHEVAKELGMAPRTVRKWVKKYEIPCTKNDYGHYVYDEEAIALLETMKGSSETAGTMEMVEIEEETEIEESLTRGPSQTGKEIKALTERIMRTEQLLHQKADEVVSYQLLQQRKEIEELTKKVEMLEQKLDKSNGKSAPTEDPPLVFDYENPSKTKRKNMFRSIFGL